jgi:hypothetical protein
MGRVATSNGRAFNGGPALAFARLSHPTLTETKNRANAFTIEGGASLGRNLRDEFRIKPILNCGTELPQKPSRHRQ